MDKLLETRSHLVFTGHKSDLRFERAEGKPLILRGYAIPFNSLSKDLGGFRERIAPTALNRVLEQGADIRALMDHDITKILGRTSAGTLRVGKDDRGLWFNADWPNVSYARDAQVSIDRGDIRGMSFGFFVPKGGDRFFREGETVIREVTDMDLREITVTSVPAYSDTSLHFRVEPSIADRISHVRRDLWAVVRGHEQYSKNLASAIQQRQFSRGK